MASPVSTWMSEVSGYIEAIDPDDRDNVPFHEVDGRRKLKGGRTFFWEPPRRGGPILLNNSSTHVEWECRLVLNFESAGRSRRDMSVSVANDTNRVARVIETYSQGGAWTTTGLWSVTQDGPPETEHLADGQGDVEVTFTFLVETSETD